MTMLLVILSLIPFYALGTFPTGYLIASRSGIDITSQGSGNVGATNVARVLGKKAGIITLFGDLCKGLLGVLIAYYLSSDAWYPSYAAIAVISGHCFSLPPYLKGGKGVATTLGAILALSPLLGLIAVAIFALLFWVKRTVSLASITAALLVPLISLACGYPDSLSLPLCLISFIIIIRHRSNIIRLVQGTEPKSSFGGKKSE